MNQTNQATIAQTTIRMAYEKQFWEQPYHDDREEERLERELLSLKLKLSTAVELLIGRIDTAMVNFENKDWQTDDDWNDILSSINFLRQIKGRDFYLDARIKIEDYLESINY